MTPAAPRPSGELVFLDELLASDELWIERPDEGKALAEHILRSDAPIIVFHGPRRSGKTELIQRYVIPVLNENALGWRVAYRGSGEMAAAATDPDSPVIEVWDDFERWLVADEPLRGNLLKRLSRCAEQRGRARVVLILEEDHLSALFQLRGSIPRLLDDVGEIPGMSQPRLLQSLAHAIGPCGVRVSTAFLEALAHDLESVRTKAGLNPEVVAVLAFELCRSKVVDRELAQADHQAVGGLTGMLEAHLDFVFERLPDSIEPQIGWAVLQQVVTVRRGQPVDLTDVSHRFDVPMDVPSRVLGWLKEDRRILRASSDGGFDVVPGQLVAAAEARAQREADAAEQSRWILRQGVRHFADGDALLSEQSFKKVHAHRSALIVDPEEAALMLRCSLAYENDLLAGATEHWLRRVKDPEVNVEILLDALCDSRADVRRRAAGRLREFARPEVRDPLHLLALRDPDEAVRAQAIDSLDAIKDSDLRASLIKEVQQKSSPYRLQAIDGLRIFTDDDTVECLVRIIGNHAPAEDLAARSRAIDALSRQGTTQSADALLGIALQDEDAEDREGAAHALGRAGSSVSSRRVLERLKQPRDSTRRPQLSLSPASAFIALAQTGVAAITVLLNFVIHGLILATIGRVRFAVALTVIEGAGFALFAWSSQGEAEALGLLLLLSTWSVGILRPTQILLSERLDGVRQSRYRKRLGAVLFAFDVVTFFFFFHGLASMLARRGRRGLVLIGFEAVGLFLLVSFDYFFEGTLVGFDQLSSTIRFVPRALTIAGYSLLAISYITGIGTVLLETFFWRDRRQIRLRIDHVYSQLLRNPAASANVLDALRSSDRKQVRWATRIAQQYRSAMRDALRGLWPEGDGATRARLLRIMAWRPDADSVEFLRTVAPTLGWRGRLRYVRSLWNFRFSVWPKPLLGLMVIAVLVLGAYIGVLYRYTQNTPEHLLQIVQREPAPDSLLQRLLQPIVQPGATPGDPRVEALKRLEGLAKSGNKQVSRMAATSLLSALADEENPITAEMVLNEILSIVPRVFGASSAVQGKSRLPELETSVQELLSNSGLNPVSRKLAVDALQQIGTPQAAAKLKEFVERPGPTRRRPGEVQPSPADDPELRLRLDAINALGSIDSAGVAPLHLLSELSHSPALPSDLRTAVDRATERADPLLRFEYFLGESDYDQALRLAQKVLGDDPRAPRGRILVAKVYGRRGLAAFSMTEYPSAEADFWKGLAAVGDTKVEPESVPDLFTLGLELEFRAHEQLALTDPQSYDASYRILSSLRTLTDKVSSQPSDDFDPLEFDANLAEASLTAGKYDEAARLAEEVLRNVPTNATPEINETALNARFIALAALVLKGDQTAAGLAREDLSTFLASLPRDFTNRWSYAGTQNYIEHAAVSAANRNMLLSELTRVQFN